MDVALFDYELPPERIAQEAVEPRDAARLLLLDRGERAARPAPLRRPGGAASAGRPAGGERHARAPARPSRARERRKGEPLLLEPAGRDGTGSAGGRSSAPPARRGAASRWRSPAATRPSCSTSRGPVRGGRRAGADRGARRRWPSCAAAYGQPPLPPYIRRRPTTARGARPRALPDRLRRAGRGGGRADRRAALHAGAAGPAGGRGDRADGGDAARRARGPSGRCAVERTGEHALHAERFTLPAAAGDAIAAARAPRRARGRGRDDRRPRARVARRRADGAPAPGAGETELFIAPGHAFRVVDALVTNFHLPRSTLLMLVAAFAGRERVLARLPRGDRARGYRFYSLRRRDAGAVTRVRGLTLRRSGPRDGARAPGAATRHGAVATPAFMPVGTAGCGQGG